MELLESSAAVAFDIHHIIENIFKYLSARDLCKAAAVCKKWSEISAEQLKHRIGIKHFIQVLPDTELNSKDPFANASKFKEELRDQFGEIRIKPAFCIAFANSSFLDNFESLYSRYSVPEKKEKISEGICFDDYEDKREYVNSVINATFKTCLPTSCKIGMYIGLDILTTNTKLGLNKSVNSIQLLNGPALTGYIFSELPGNQLELPECKENGAELVNFLKSRDDIESVLALIEHKYISFLSMCLKNMAAFNKSLFNPVRIGSSNVPIFKGNNVEFLCLPVSEKNSKEDLKDKVRDKHFNPRNTVAFVLSDGVSDSVFQDCNSFLQQHPGIPMIGFCGRPPLKSDYRAEIKPLENIVEQNIPKLEFGYKFLLISFKDV